MIKYYTVARETNDIIDEFDTMDAALTAISEYESSDLKDGIYEENFYDVMDVEYLSTI